jgi:taurine dioxygenase
VRGVGLREAIRDEFTAASIGAAFAEHHVLLFRNQNEVTPTEHVEFTELFGPVEPHPLSTRPSLVDGKVILLEHRPPAKVAARNDFWHSDISFSAAPPAATVLIGRETPGPGLGNTLFANMNTVLPALDAADADVLANGRGWHSAEKLFHRNNDSANDDPAVAMLPDAVAHPAVRTHDVTGTPSVFINPYFTTHIDGVSAEESAGLIARVTEVATHPDNTYIHEWHDGDVLMWDNRCTWHYAVRGDFEDQVRVMHRTTAGGVRPFFAGIKE